MKCVYKISSVNDDIKEFYIGSTEDFKKRAKQHKDKYNIGCKTKVYTFIRENGGLKTWDIYPIEIIDFPISTEELRQYEQGYLDKYKPELNCNRAITTHEQKKEYKKNYGIDYYIQNKEKRKEYLEKNKEKISLKQKEYKKKYYAKNVEKYAEKNKIKANCPHCNMIMIKNNINRHIKTQHSTLL